MHRKLIFFALLSAATSAQNLPNTQAPLNMKSTASANMANWTQALDNCKNQVVQLAVLADSYGTAWQGDGSSSGPTLYTDRYPDQWRAWLNAKCGSAGTGIVPFVKYLIPSSPNPDNVYYTASSGTWGYDATLGPSQTPLAGTYSGTTLGSWVTASSGYTVTWTTSSVGNLVDHVQMICATGPSYGAWSVAVKDAAVSTTLASFSCGGNSTTPTATLATSGAFTAQIVNVYLSCPTGPCKMRGVGGLTGTKGAIVHNWSLGSGAEELYTATNAFTDLDLLGVNGIINQFGTNEPSLGFSTSSFSSALTALITHEQATATAPPVLVFTSPVSNASGASSQPSYAAAAYSVAQAKGVPYANLIENWGATYKSSLFGSDGIHPNTQGAASEYAIQKNAFTDVEGTLSFSGITSYPGAGVAISTGSAWGTSYALAGAGPGIVTGSTTTVVGDIASYTTTGGQESDSGFLHTLGFGSGSSSSVYTGIGPVGSPQSHCGIVVGLQGMCSFNSYYNGSNWVRDQTGYATTVRYASAGTPGTQGYQLSVSPSGSAGSTITGMDSTDVAMLALPGNHIYFNPGTASPSTVNLTDALVVNSGRSFIVDTSGNTTENSTITGLVTPTGTAPTVASSSTVAIVTNLASISGTSAISSITAETGFTFGCKDILATGAWTTVAGTSANNTATAMTAVAGTQYRACKYSDNLWRIK